MGNTDDWKAKLAASYGMEKPKDEKKETDWAKKAEQYNSMSRNSGKGGNYNQNRAQQNGRRNSPNNYSSRSNSSADASAPYNFVSLPGVVVPSPLDQKLNWKAMDEDEVRTNFKDFILREGALSGKLELEMETVTPCFIGGNGEEFFAPGGTPTIPGSSLRGMTKNLLKIITCGAMRRDEDFYDHHLYFRDFAGRVKSFREHYKKCMVEMVKVKKDDGTTELKPRSKAHAGFIIRIKGEYYICPAQAKAIYSPRECNKGESIKWYEDGSADIFTGKMFSKKTYMHIYNPVWDEDNRIPVPKTVVEDYRADKNRDGLDLFANARTGSVASGYTHQENVDFVVPCYYTAQDGVVKHFGHGRYYRIAYDKSIGDHVPEAMQTTAVDFADAMFGSKELWASRVFFDDARLVGEPDYADKDFSHPLMTPNPTSFQLYLKQQENTVQKHWDDEADLRGYKLYWHQAIGKKDWQITKDVDKQVNGMKQIHPLSKGNRFKGSIRFANLNPIELGALCKVFHLAENGEEIVYKIGQGKSIGMGSIRIKAKLFIEDKAARYAKLFQGDSWNTSIQEQNENEYIQAFNSYLGNALGENRNRYDTAMKELRTMLNWNQTKLPDWKERTTMMNPTQKGDNRLKDRIVLKDAVKFVSESFKK